MMAAAFPGLLFAQDDRSSSTYVAVECMKSSAPGYEQLELEVWLPAHQYLVNKGKRNSWALYRVMYGDRSRCDYYTVTTYRGVDQLNAPAGYEEAFAAVHADHDFGKLVSKTLAAREHVASELWLQATRPN